MLFGEVVVMYIMPSSCFSDSSKSTKEPVKETSSESRTIEKLISENPLIFRIFCCCMIRRRKRVDTAKQNGTSNYNNDNNSDGTVLNIDQIELTQTTPITHET